jgi:hypothetical protein
MLPDTAEQSLAAQHCRGGRPEAAVLSDLLRVKENTMRYPIVAAAMALAGVAMTTPVQAQYVQAGMLVCDITGGVGFVVTSQRQLSCRFRNALGEPEVYSGVINRVGLDLGATAGGQLLWVVFAPSGQFGRGALAGNYAGASAEATVGLGVGANVLFGGSERSIALQPVSVQGQTGLNAAVGIAGLQLREPARFVSERRVIRR